MLTLPSERFVGRSRSEPPCGFAPEADGISRPVFQSNAGAFGISTHAQVLGLRRVRSHLANNGTLDVAFSLTQQDRHTEVVPVFNYKTGSSMAGLRYPSHGCSRQSGHPVRPSAEGRSSWLNFLRKTLAFSIPNRFYPGTLCPLYDSLERDAFQARRLKVRRLGDSIATNFLPKTFGLNKLNQCETVTDRQKNGGRKIIASVAS